VLSWSKRLEALCLAFPPPRRLVRILGSIVLAQTLLAKTNEPLRNADILLASIRLAKLATSRLANSFSGEFVHLSDLVCIVRLIG
jgi:hypothetical protein